MRRLLGIVLVASAVSLPAPARADACDWPMYGRDLGRSMAQSAECTSVSASNVALLHPKWTFNAGAPVTGQPAVADGLVYVGAADGMFYALPADAVGVATPAWSFRVTDANADSYGKFASSAAVTDVAGTKVVVAAGVSTLYALDAATGAELASVCFDPRTDPAVRCAGSDGIIEIESSPAVVPVDDTHAAIYIGMDYNEGGDPGGDNAGRAGVVKLTLSASGGEWTMNPDWKFDPEALAVYTTDVFSAGGPGNGCGNVWSSPAVDIAHNLVYFDTANCATNRYQNTALYGGESTFAIDATTGALAWCHAPRPINDQDLDYGASPNLLPGDRVGVGGKDGIYSSFTRTAEGSPDVDPATACRDESGHQPEWATTISTGSDIGGIIGTPAVGKVKGVDAVFATNALPRFPDFPPGPDTPGTYSPPQRLLTLHALDLADGRVLWDAPTPFPAYSGPVYANGVVFAPATVGMSFTAYAADSGLPLWTFPMFAPSGPPAIVGDTVYVGSGVAPAAGTPVLSNLGIVYAFQV